MVVMVRVAGDGTSGFGRKKLVITYDGCGADEVLLCWQQP